MCKSLVKQFLAAALLAIAPAQHALADADFMFDQITTEIWHTLFELPDQANRAEFEPWEEYLIFLFENVPDTHHELFLEELGWSQNDFEFSKEFHARIDSPLAQNLLSMLATLPPPSGNLDDEPSAELLGNICFSDGTHRTLSTQDAVWMAKMIDGETWGKPTPEDGAAMLWAIAQRSNIRVYKTWDLQKLIKAYSQPINPIWTRTGSKCESFYDPSFQGNVPERCSLRRIERREANIRKSWKDTAPIARQAVLDFAQGRSPNPIIGAVGWFAPNTWDSRERSGKNARNDQIFHSEIDGNVYYSLTTNPNTFHWDGSEAWVVPHGQACP